MVSRKILKIIGILILLTAGWFAARFIFGGSEDDWIKDSRGVWVKHGAPSEIPDYVLEQQEMIFCASALYDNFTDKSALSSQCLGVCGDYSVDVVHAPRTEEDDKTENQCKDYREGNVGGFIELNNKNGEIVRIA